MKNKKIKKNIDNFNIILINNFNIILLGFIIIYLLYLLFNPSPPKYEQGETETKDTIDNRKNTMTQKKLSLLYKGEDVKNSLIVQDKSDYYLIITEKNGKQITSINLSESNTPDTNYFYLDSPVLSKIIKTKNNCLLFNTKVSIYKITPACSNCNNNFPIPAKYKRNKQYEYEYELTGELAYILKKDKQRIFIQAKRNEKYFILDFDAENGIQILDDAKKIEKFEKIIACNSDDEKYPIIIYQKDENNLYLSDIKIKFTSIKLPEPKNPNVGFYINKLNNNKGEVFTIGNNGVLIYLKKEDGSTPTTIFTETNIRYFLYKNISGDKWPEYIFITDNNNIIVYNKTRDTVCNISDLPAEIKIKPYFIEYTKSLYVVLANGSIYCVSFKNTPKPYLREIISLPDNIKDINKISGFFNHDDTTILIINSDKNKFYKLIDANK